MPGTEDGSGDTGHGHGGEMGLGQAGGQTGILHPHFDGQGHHLFPAHAGELADGKAQQIPQHIVEHHHQEDQSGAVQDGVPAGSDDPGDQEADHQTGNGGQVIHRFLGEFGEEVLHRQAHTDGHKHDLEDGNEHAHGIKGDLLAHQQPGQKRGHDGAQHRGAAGHGHGKGHIPMAHEGDHVGGRPAGAGAHQHHPHRQGWIQMEGLGEQKSQKGHDEILGADPEENVLGLLQHQGEIVEAGGHPHAEHDDPQHDAEDGDPVGLPQHPGKSMGGEKPDAQEHHSDDAEILADQSANFFQTHFPHPFFFRKQKSPVP